MKDVVVVDAAPAETQGFQEVGSYTIQADAKMFRILIDGLYSDKPRAILRELCANARDSHAAAGILDRPFKLQLPTRWDETFAVRDYGVSLTHDQVMHLYTTVGASTKGDSNLSVGKFGLGSKTPFAYTDSFTITAILDGVKRMYNAFMDAGTPKIALLVTEPTEEEQGVEISFAVQHKDHNAFLTAAKRVLLGFDVVPVNNAELEKVHFDVMFEGQNWKIVKKDHDNAMSGPMVRQGCIFYPIDVAALRAVRSCEALDALTEEVLILDMPIGSVDITPSRESLSYDPVTAKNIIDKCGSVFVEVMDRFTYGVSSAKTLFEAVRAKQQVLSGITNYRFRERVSVKLRWRGSIVPASIALRQGMVAVLRKHGVRLSQIRWYSGSGGRRRSTYELYSTTNLSFTPDEVPTFVYHESEVMPKFLKYRMASVNQLARHVYFLGNFTPGSRAETYLRVALGRPDVEIKFVDLMDIEFTKPDYQRKAVSINVFDPGLNEFKSVMEDDLDGEVYYVRTYKNAITHCGRDVGYGMIPSVLDTLKQLGLIERDAVVVGIPASRKDYATSVPEGWEDFFEYARRKIALNFDGVKAQKAVVLEKFREESYNSRWIDTIHRLAAFAQVHSADSAYGVAVSVIKEHVQAKTIGDFDQKLNSIIPMLFEKDEAEELIPPDEHVDVSELFDAKQAFQAAYPLLRRNASAHMEEEEAVEWGQYMTLLDRSEGEKRSYDALAC